MSGWCKFQITEPSVANLAGGSMHGFRFGEGDLVDATATAVKSSAVAFGMITLRLGARADIDHAALQRFKSLEAVQFSYATCNVLRTFKWCKLHTRKNYCQYDCCYCLHD